MSPRSLLLLGAVSVACAGAPPPPYEVRFPLERLEDLGEGLAVKVPVEVHNPGPAPLAITELSFGGLGQGQRRLAIPAERGGLRVFGFVPSGETARYHVGLHFPDPGTGTVRLTVHARILPPDTPGRLMEEVHLPTAGEDTQVVVERVVTVAPRAFTRAAALARAGGAADTAVYSRTLGAWVVRRGNDTLVVEVRQTTSFPGLTLEAVALMDAHDEAVPVLAEDGSVSPILKGPALRAILDRAQRRGRRVEAVTYSPGRKALRVAP